MHLSVNGSASACQAENTPPIAGYIDGMLLLPLIIEHTIDERSPLCGHTHDSLMALNAVRKGIERLNLCLTTYS